MGMKKGDTVSLMMPNGYQTTKLFLGIMYAGMTVSPLNLHAQPAHLEYVLDHSDANVVFVDKSESDRLNTAIRKVKRDIRVSVIDIDQPALFSSNDTTDTRLPDVGEQDSALLLYTSGTTGRPKGVVLTHGNMVAGGEYTTGAHRLTSEDRALCSLPLYHINAEVVSAVAPLIRGGSVVVPHRFSVTDFWELLSTYRCTWFSVVPTIISYLVSGGEIKDRDYRLQQVRFGRSASDALPPSLHTAFEKKFGMPIIETMGLTETAGPVFSNPVEKEKRKYGSPGQAVGNRAKVVDRNGNEVSPGTVGEIMIKGDNVMKTYYKAKRIADEAMEPDGWLHTGDMGYVDEDGFYFITGRLKELIIKGGENIAPREIDEALYRHPSVLEAAAVGIPDKHYGEEILAGVALRPGTTCTEADLLKHCKKHLGDYKMPKSIKFLPDLPKGPSGKIQRLRLRELFGY